MLVFGVPRGNPPRQQELPGRFRCKGRGGGSVVPLSASSESTLAQTWPSHSPFPARCPALVCPSCFIKCPRPKKRTPGTTSWIGIASQVFYKTPRLITMRRIGEARGIFDSLVKNGFACPRVCYRISSARSGTFSEREVFIKKKRQKRKIHFSKHGKNPSSRC